jgi:hypothetical protein
VLILEGGIDRQGSILNGLRTGDFLLTDGFTLGFVAGGGLTNSDLTGGLIGGFNDPLLDTLLGALYFTGVPGL